MNTSITKGCWTLKEMGQEISHELQILAGRLSGLSVFSEYDRIHKIISPFEEVNC